MRSRLCPVTAYSDASGMRKYANSKDLSLTLPCDGDMRCIAGERPDSSSARDHDSTARTCAGCD
eukprot:758864-Hanusia_phi.AAC.2